MRVLNSPYFSSLAPKLCKSLTHDIKVKRRLGVNLHLHTQGVVTHGPNIVHFYTTLVKMIELNIELFQPMLSIAWICSLHLRNSDLSVLDPMVGKWSECFLTISEWSKWASVVFFCCWGNLTPNELLAVCFNKIWHGATTVVYLCFSCLYHFCSVARLWLWVENNMRDLRIWKGTPNLAAWFRRFLITLDRRRDVRVRPNQIRL